MTKEMEKNELMGERLLKLRNQNGLTQEGLAEQLDVSRQSVSKWELNKTLPDVDKLIQLSEMYHVSIDYLVTGKGGDKTGEYKEKDENGTDHENRQDFGNDINSTEFKVKRIICFVCILLSGFLCLCMTFFAGRLLMNNTINRRDKEQNIVCVEKIYEQYTKAEIYGDDFHKKMVWLDIPGVREGDYVFCYMDKENAEKFSFDYYSKTLIVPVIFGIIFLIFFIAFLTEWQSSNNVSAAKRNAGKGESKNGEE